MTIPAEHIHSGPPHQHSALMLCLLQVSTSGHSPWPSTSAYLSFARFSCCMECVMPQSSHASTSWAGACIRQPGTAWCLLDACCDGLHAVIVASSTGAALFLLSTRASCSLCISTASWPWVLHIAARISLRGYCSLCPDIVHGVLASS